jgi:hypothetical protein
MNNKKEGRKNKPQKTGTLLKVDILHKGTRHRNGEISYTLQYLFNLLFFPDHGLDESPSEDAAGPCKSTPFASTTPTTKSSIFF